MTPRNAQRRKRAPAWLRGFIQRYRADVARALALGFAAAGCAALLMFTSGYLISATALATTTLFSIMTPIACVQLFGFGRPAARYLERLASHNWVLRVTSDLRVMLYRSIAERTCDPARSRAAGEYLSALADDVEHLQNLYLRVVFPTIIAYLLVLGASLLFGFFSIPFALIILLSLAIVSIVLPYTALLSTRAAAERAKSLTAKEYARLTDDVYGATDWALSGRYDQVLVRHHEADAEIRALEASTRTRQRTVSLVATLALGGMLVATVAWAGNSFGSSSATANWIAAFALGFFPLIESFAALPAAFSETTAHGESVERLNEYLASDDPQRAESWKRAGKSTSHLSGHPTLDDPQQFENQKSRQESPGRLSGHPAPDDPQRAESGQGAAGPAETHPAHEETEGADNSGTVEANGSTDTAILLDHVSYRYPHASRATLADIDLAFARGTATAILGRSGSGKSTLVDLICGTFPPDGGTISLLGRELEPNDDLSHVVGYLGQTPYLFNRTLRDNLTMGVNDASDERLIEAMESVGLAHKLAALPRGLDTMVGETGVGFSGGEEHRVALARILVADTPIVVLDEPFSAIDPETERDLIDMLLDAFSGKTIVVVTHHLAEITRFDRVVFIESGRVDLDGTPYSLMKASERFRALAEFDEGIPPEHAANVSSAIGSASCVNTVGDASYTGGAGSANDAGNASTRRR